MGSGSMEMFEAAAAQERIPRRLLLAAIARVLGVVAGTLLVYFLVPTEEESAARAAALSACVGIATILIVFARQISRVSRSQRPVLAAIEALALVFGLFLCLFALLYVSVSATDPAAFTQEVDKVAGLYFTTTVLTTVGFGDISPVSDTARILVTLQMVLGMILIGTAFKALGFSAKRAVTSLRSATAADIAADVAADVAAAEMPPGPSAEDGPGSASARG
jgi:voltage-gated potassium channel